MIGILTLSLSLLLLIIIASYSNMVTATSINEMYTCPKGKRLFSEEILSEYIFCYAEVETCTQEIVAVAGGVFGLMFLIIICLATLLLAQNCKRYDRDCSE